MFASKGGEADEAQAPLREESWISRHLKKFSQNMVNKHA